MIKDVMVSLDGTAADEVRLAAVADIAEYFDVHVTGLFLNVLPLLAPSEWDGIGARTAAQVLEEAARDDPAFARVWAHQRAFRASHARWQRLAYPAPDAHAAPDEGGAPDPPVSPEAREAGDGG